MRVLVLFAHPVETSFNAALHAQVVQSLTEAGHEVDDLDLYAEDFDPRLSREERLNYHDLETNQMPVQGYVDRVQRAEALVICTPVWNFGHPAILKGFFDRVFLPGVSFKMRDGKVRPSLHNIRKLAVVTTYGGARLRAFLVGDPPRKIATRVLRAIIKPAAPVAYHALYDMNRVTDAQRKSFLDKVGVAMEKF
ncbi:NAD(P)H-dependent oxidoreductase [Roseibium sp. CAU 1637]|uniref:NAD(P)H-dependent oxidoreductase n=1 Tax=Roseibium limicola TaxID=2816037 RepID=A0A939EQE4_9HYPH|nr:NAD(P)H-dependent oxidoreductase [Roseibium limicola]MBO0347020.1 NAD(P)H-dependent oxidoreductase [Roseibium limicola]